MALWTRRRMGGSLFAYLLCLCLIPLVSFAGLAVIQVRQAHARSATAAVFVSAMRVTSSLEALQTALIQENCSADALTNAGVSAATMNALKGVDVSELIGFDIKPLNQTRAATDAAMARLGSVPDLASTTRTVAAARARLLDPRTDQLAPGVTVDDLLGDNGYPGLIAVVGRAEIQTSQGISGGRYGPTGARLARRAGELAATTTLVVQGDRLTLAVLAASLAPPGHEAPQVSRMRRVAEDFRAMSDVLGSTLSGPLAAQWTAFTQSATPPVTADLVPQLLRGSSSGSADRPPSIQRLIKVAKILMRFSDQLRAMLSTAVRLGVAAAQADGAQASAHARDVLAYSAGLLAVVTLMIFSIWNGVRHRLRLLTGCARQLSSGEFATVGIRGPREFDVFAQGLNDAVLTFDRVLTSAERVAAGDLQAPELREPVQGRLGSAVHAAFERIVEVMRERDLLQTQLAHQADHDALTGLANRALAGRLLSEALRDGNQGLAVLFVDLDRFKHVNDTYGHPAGDHVLRVTASRMASQVRDGDHVCRLGGDEFLMILQGSDEDAAAVGARVVTAVEEPIAWDGPPLSVGASVGIAVRDPGEGITAEELLAEADRALYRAKAAGRGRVST